MVISQTFESNYISDDSFGGFAEKKAMSPDRITKEQRSKTMQAVRSTGSKIEQALQKALWKRGFRYRKNYKKVCGKPDITFMSLKIAIFVDSEFWHGYDWENRKHDFQSNQDFWWNKIERNLARDKVVTEKLRNEGWIVIRFWGSEVTGNLDRCVEIVSEAVEKRRKELDDNNIVYEHKNHPIA